MGKSPVHLNLKLAWRGRGSCPILWCGFGGANWSHRRRWVETKMQCVKLLGRRLATRDFDTQIAKAHVSSARAEWLHRARLSPHASRGIGRSGNRDLRQSTSLSIIVGRRSKSLAELAQIKYSPTSKIATGGRDSVTVLRVFLRVFELRNSVKETIE